MGQKRPNILFITVDQMRFPRLRDKNGGMSESIKRILGFDAVDASQNQYTQYFPGFMRLRQNAVAMRQHMIASSACVPSRATIYTGQYGTKTRVVETDSLYKYGSDPNFPWLHPKGIPTIGDWFRTAGYSTHYFGKWDLSYVDAEGPGQGDLNPWGFSDWRLCVPDAQGGQLNQLGVYRDPGYVDLVDGFLRRKAMNYQNTPHEPQPWFCVASIVNPHDIASAYPLNWWMPRGLTVKQRMPDGTIADIPVTGVQTAMADTPTVRPIPEQGAKSNAMPGGRIHIELNPKGFPGDTFALPDTLHEDLSTKPDCQFDYSYKMGLALKSRRPPSERPYQTLPFQTQNNSDEWFKAYGDFYSYLHTLADTQIHRILQTLDATGLTQDTIVVFLSDHGEYGAAHGGMIEKWHSAYDEILHVPMVISSPLVNADSQLRHVDQLTSHVDVLPTLLGLVGFDYEAQDQLGQSIQGHTYEPLPGADLTSVINDPGQSIILPNGEKRDAVLFMTDDTITQYLWGEAAPAAYEIFLEEVEQQRKNNVPLQSGSVRQPCHIRCVRNSEWKLARYFDPLARVGDQWELYYHLGDPTEIYNLVTWNTRGEPIPCPDRLQVEWPIDEQQLIAALEKMRGLLVQLEEYYLGGPKPVEEPYTLEEMF